MVRHILRTTLDLDEDVLAAAKELSRQRGISAGKVVSGLVRQALSGRVAASHKGRAGVGGFRPFAARGTPVTNDRINELRDADGG